MNYRKLSSDEIQLLKNNGCSSSDWDKISVSQGFDARNIFNSNFLGDIFLGNNLCIKNINKLSDYKIDDNVVIENVSEISMDGESTFGNGLKIKVLNEGGGRELKIFDKLSSQIGYMLVTCRHDSTFIERLESLIEDYSSTRKSKIGYIGKNSLIKNCSIIKNLWIGESCEIQGVTSLSEGTILSNYSDPVKIENNVIAKNFIIQSGSKISDAVLIDNCFVGQSVKLGKQFSAENCAIFSNCECFHGEAVSIFAGPYTVTHHKSTLLIAAMFSFYNAGSGSNQSNHMYKLGPIHQGIFERGAKTGSFSYLLWPSRVGAFSVVIGKHYSNFDSSEFPFSYLNEENGKTVLTPAMNLFSVGTRRDSQKWPIRDIRKDAVKFDLLHFNLYNPYVISKMLKGSDKMKELLEKANREQEYVSYKGMLIKRLLLKTSIKYYEMAVKIFIGNQILNRIQIENTHNNYNLIINRLKYDKSLADMEWVDAAGMFIPKREYENLLNEVSTSKIKSLNDLYEHLGLLYSKFDEYAWSWCAKLIEERLKISIENISKEQLSQLLIEWRENNIKLNNMILKDAEKEFDQASKIGFGIDGDEKIRDEDFINVRGAFENNNFVSELKKESERIYDIAEKSLQILNSSE